MNKPTLIEYFDMLLENDQLDKSLADIQMQLSQVEARINQTSQPLIAQRMRLQKRQNTLLQQKQAADKQAAIKNKNMNQQANIQQQQMQQQMGNQGNNPVNLGINPVGQQPAKI
jgi:hypothetical protein